MRLSAPDGQYLWPVSALLQKRTALLIRDTSRKELSEARGPSGLFEGFFSKQPRARAVKVESGSRGAGLESELLFASWVASDK